MKFKGYIFIGVVIFIGCSIIAAYLFYKPSEKLNSKDHQVEILAHELFRIYENDENEGNDKFLNKVVLVSGKILSISDKIIVVGEKDQSVSCKLDEINIEKIQMFNIGQEIRIKGLCSGLGLFDVNLTKCIIEE